MEPESSQKLYTHFQVTLSQGSEKTSQKKPTSECPIYTPQAGPKMMRRHGGSVTRAPLHAEDFEGFMQAPESPISSGCRAVRFAFI